MDSQVGGPTSGSRQPGGGRERRRSRGPEFPAFAGGPHSEPAIVGSSVVGGPIGSDNHQQRSSSHRRSHGQQQQQHSSSLHEGGGGGGGSLSDTVAPSLSDKDLGTLGTLGGSTGTPPSRLESRRARVRDQQQQQSSNERSFGDGAGSSQSLKSQSGAGGGVGSGGLSKKSNSATQLSLSGKFILV